MKKLYAVFIILIFMLSGCGYTPDKSSLPKLDSFKSTLTAAFVDVGQGDSEIVRTPNGKYILIDTGSSEDRDKIMDFISYQDIKSFSAVILTHPHEDHIGNMPEILKKKDVDVIYMPRVSSNISAFYNTVLEAKKRRIPVKEALAGKNFSIDGVQFSFVAPTGSKYSDLNNYSAALRVTWSKSSMLFMGDAEKLSENAILKSGAEIKSDIIKVGHHGSSSSSSYKFIKTVSPEAAIISCGVNNDYHHPHKKTLTTFKKLNIRVLRTDLNGTIIVSAGNSGYKIQPERQ